VPRCWRSYWKCGVALLSQLPGADGLKNISHRISKNIRCIIKLFVYKSITYVFVTVYIQILIAGGRVAT
jgi:hypothetical protein